MDAVVEWQRDVQGCILIVEDSKTVASVISLALRRELDLECVIAESYNTAVALLGEGGADFSAAVLDVNLPDAPNGQIVDYVTSLGIPSVVFTGELAEGMRENMWSKQIADYIMKDGCNNIQQLVGVVYRLLTNVGQHVLVVDDSKTTRSLLAALLKRWNLTVHEAENGQVALEKLTGFSDYSLIIVDYEMPVMGGLEFVKEVRRRYPKQQVPILGMSAAATSATSAFFLKAGANDYLHKPFETEEFYCRVGHSLETREYVDAIRNLAERDPLTGLYNRRSFFYLGRKLIADSLRKDDVVLLGMLDIDHFKRCNDTFGHDGGDQVIKVVAEKLQAFFDEKGVVARIGGEEFCVMVGGVSVAEGFELFEQYRVDIQKTIVPFGDKHIEVTVSIGVDTFCADGLEAMMKRADDALYRAKTCGRNRTEDSCRLIDLASDHGKGMAASGVEDLT